jgi:hypothetical protein
LGALSSKANIWWISIVLLVIATAATIPIVFDDRSKIGFLGLAVARCGDMLPHNYAELGVIVNRMGGSKIIKERRSQNGSAFITALWVLGYSSASVISGFVYQYVGFHPIVIAQLIGSSAHIAFRFFLCSVHHGSSNDCSSADVRDISAQQQQQQHEKTTRKRTRLSFPIVTWSYVFLGMFFHAAPVAIWITFARLYQDRFGVGTGISCIVQTVGDLIGSVWVMYKGHLRSQDLRGVHSKTKTSLGPIHDLIRYVQRIWCFRTPRDISTSLLMLGISLLMMCSSSLAVVIIAHIGTGIFYVVLAQNSATGLLIYCQVPFLLFLVLLLSCSLLIQSFIHPLTHSSTHPLTHPLTQTHTHTLTHTHNHPGCKSWCST